MSEESGTDYAIDADGMRLVYEDGTEAVKNVDLTVPEGEFFGFLGPNGAGKTTAIKVLSTLLSPTDGTVRVNGFDVIAEPKMVRRTIGYMAQETSVDQELTARENVSFACEAYGVPRSERGDRIDELLELVDLADVADKRASEFSGGMKKRLDAATALVHRPPLVFLDEPTTGLDPSARNRLWEYFRRINDEGTTIFLTTQYLEEADQLCDRISVILDGEIVATGSPTELKRRVGGDVLDVDIEGGEDGDEGDAGEEDEDGEDGDEGDAGEEDEDGEDGEDATDRALAIAREAGLFEPDATIQRTDDGISVTATDARQRGPDLLVALKEAGIQVVGFNVREPTLDDVFLSITGEHVDVDEPAPEVVAE